MEELVAPSAGAWIEISGAFHLQMYGYLVAPSAGAWIEIATAPPEGLSCSCRSLRGSVD